MSDELIQLSLATRRASLLPACQELIDQALVASALVCKVDDDASNAVAVQAHQELAGVERAIEKARKACKEPILDLGRSIDRVAEEAKAELRDETFRIGKLTADWAALQAAKLRAAQEAARVELAEAERLKQAALANATSHEEQERIKEDAERAAYKASQKVLAAQPTRAEGQVVKTDWSITIVDLIALSRAHPSCVKIEAKLMEIKSLLNQGIEVVGVQAVKVTTSGVRTTGKTLDI